MHSESAMGLRNDRPSRSLRRRVAASPMGLGAGYLVRVRAVLRHLLSEATVSLAWVVRSRETTNFNYELKPLNRLHLAWWVAEATGERVDVVLGLFDELDSDEQLRQHIRSTTATSEFRRVSDADVRYGRRLGWYALVRLLSPTHVVETGIDKGLGTCVLAAALMRNGIGRVTAIDREAEAGWLVTGAYAAQVDLVIGDAARVISDCTTPIDLLVHDVHYTAEQERSEYEAALPRLGHHPAILNDNAHGHAVLPELAMELGWHFSLFREVSAGHWYPGAAMALAWPRESQQENA